MAQIIHITNTTSVFMIDTPDKPTDTVVIFLPGISGDAFSDRFKFLVDACLQSGLAIARVNAWKNIDEVEKKNLREIYQDIESVISYLQQQGYIQIFGIGKSFGGTIMLTFPSVHIIKKVLWSPAIGVTKSDTNLDTYMITTLGNLSSMLDLRVDRTFLQGIESPVLIVHGTADKNIPFSNSENLASMLPRVTLLPVEGADHSYRDKNHETSLINATIKFLVTNTGVF